ncbi:ATP-dependent 6-phosphofructokinase [Aestuariispira insulae]|uniref:ATP-dependent 6-phosphofructokinase n=1 Tax=Aestuariispira insulae TaxID=1461337 RepID=A0A3D9HXA8_9PROT|nr:ATP-dependent 6-phosphofructokinase [Aestuariispira insulae]RED54138.1 6-phosphofructokinase 1 [Aestuariispira insulae]
MKKIKKIGILTSGGDCAGLNAILRAVVKRAEGGYGWEVYGIEKGTHGLYARPPLLRRLRPGMFNGALLRQAGTILGTTNKGDPFAYPMEDGSTSDRSDELIEGFQLAGLDALIGVGGDGSQAILLKLAEKGGIPLVCIPKTIDNDIGATEVAVGYDTAMQVATDALDKLQPTAASHDRVMVLEVMGRDAGHIALNAGIAGGADVILIPEISYDLENVATHIRGIYDRGRNFALVVVAEATPGPASHQVTRTMEDGQVRYGGVGHWVGQEIAQRTGAEVRVTVLGHIQRGGVPTPRDRLMASVFGVRAVDLLAQGKAGHMVAWVNRQVTELPIRDAIAAFANVDVAGPLVSTARGLGICFGDGKEA